MGPVPVPWWRYLLTSALMAAFYFGVRAVAAAPQTHPAFLGPAVVLGGAVGLLVGWREAAVLSSSAPTGDRRSRSRRAISKSAARSYFAGLVGIALILAQSLSSAGVEWLTLGGVALMVGAAGHAWVMARHYERARASLAD